ncbi:DUF134 domain-containing protein [Methanotorris formicicus]|uniref:UPF0251 protein MetfoDRAFT_0503 n=1 Tax=Methanotorris formicicus Mc-S-70 TaxID=647171 RepID=H1KXI0_9EURY|nr:DUF134 domain-containing protein [Methanotorris formicicus]EHP88283.1 protein of unknown function DUF134 [Methanotorris formicicus Mc-S-70]
MRFRRGRPKIPRLISEEPKLKIFKPQGIPGNDLEIIKMEVDELETIRLVDLLGYEHEEAARAMGISRRVFWNILKSARKKIADALINGKGLKIEGGFYKIRKCKFDEKCGKYKYCRFKPKPCRVFESYEG